MKKTLCLLLMIVSVCTIAQSSDQDNKTQTIPPTPEICMVTADSLSEYNFVFWNKSAYASGDTFLIYRDTGNYEYTWIGSVPYDSLSSFKDTVRNTNGGYGGNPMVSSCNYKLSVKNSNNDTSELSPFHRTLYVVSSGTGNFVLYQYQIEGQAIPIPSVVQWDWQRDDNSTGNWHSIGTMAATQSSFTDINYVMYPLGSWRVKANWTITCSDSIGKINHVFNMYDSPYSNVVSSGASMGVKTENGDLKLIISPNPANNELFIRTNIRDEVKVSVLNILGQTVISRIYTTNEFSFDVSTLDDGTYFIKANDGNRMITKKLIKN